MWLPVALTVGSLVLTAAIARRVWRRSASAAWLDVGAVSADWLAQYRSSTSDAPFA